jgi:hypothetical protein
MSHQPSAPSACLVALAGVPLPNSVVPRLFNRQPSSSRIEPLASQIQSFCAKRLDDSQRASPAPAWKTADYSVQPFNRFLSPSRRPGEQATHTNSRKCPHSSRLAAGTLLAV